MAKGDGYLPWIIIGVFVLFLFDHGDSDWWNGTTRVGYAIAQHCNDQSGECKTTRLPPVTYRIVRSQNQVVWFKWQTGDIGSFTNCTIWDRMNWTCGNGEYRMVDGRLRENYLDMMGSVHHVAWYEWGLYEFKDDMRGIEDFFKGRK